MAQASGIQNYGVCYTALETTYGEGKGAAWAGTDAVYMEDFQHFDDLSPVERNGMALQRTGWRDAPGTEEPGFTCVSDILPIALAAATPGVVGSEPKPKGVEFLNILGLRADSVVARDPGNTNPSITYVLDDLSAGSAAFKVLQRLSSNSGTNFRTMEYRGVRGDGNISVSAGDRLMVNITRALAKTVIRQDETIDISAMGLDYRDDGKWFDGAAEVDDFRHRTPFVGLGSTFAATYTEYDGTTGTYGGQGVENMTLTFNNNLVAHRTMSDSSGISEVTIAPQQKVQLEFDMVPDAFADFDAYELARKKHIVQQELIFLDGESNNLHGVMIELPVVYNSVSPQYSNNREVYRIQSAMVYADQGLPTNPLRITFFSDYEGTGRP